MLETNPETPRQDVYGLTAITLHRLNLLRDAHSVVCALRQVNADGSIELLANNHRFYRLQQGTVDPLYTMLTKQGKRLVCGQQYRIPTYPVALAVGLIAQLERNVNYGKRTQQDQTQGWFDNSIHRIARRYRLPPDLFGIQSGSRSDGASPQYSRMRQKFEGILRGFTKRMAEESEQWKAYLAKALEGEFPEMSRPERIGLIQRLESVQGPPLPRDVYRQRKKVKLIEPELGGASGGSH